MNYDDTYDYEDSLDRFSYEKWLDYILDTDGVDVDAWIEENYDDSEDNIDDGADTF